jgi:hypothetical protein
MNMGDFLENKILDLILRGQAYTPPETVYVALFTSAEGEAGGGTEVSGGNYARASIASSMANWSGTQAQGSTTASSGTSGTIYNNGSIAYPAPAANWGVVTYIGIFDALTGGNLLFWAPLVTAKTINSGDPAPSFPANSLSVQIDN